MATKPKLALIPSAYKASKVYSVLPADGVGDFDFSRPTTATRINEDGLIETVGSNIPRLNYPMIDGVVSGCPSLLLEPESRNLIPYSEDFTQINWGKTNLTINANQISSPNGDLTADIISPTSDTTVTFLSDSVSITSGLNYTFSIFAKKGASDTLQLASSTDFVTSNFQNFNLTNGTLGANSLDVNTSSKIENYGNGWYRCSITSQSISSSGGGRFLVTLVSDDTQPRLSTVGLLSSQNINIWGAQFEQGSYATSYIPTNGSEATRDAETCTGAGDANTFNDSEGVLMAEISALVEDDSVRYISLNDGSTSNRIRFGYTTPTNSFRLLVVSTGSAQVDLSEELSNITLFNKLAIKYKENDFAIWSNGFKIAVDTIGITPSNLSQLDFDNAGGGDNFYGNTKQIQYFDTVLNDTELEELTSWTSFSEMARDLLYTIQ